MIRKAVIDLGTNTFTLLIADVSENSFEIIAAEKNGVALGMGGIHKKTIHQSAFKRGIEAIEAFKKECDKYQVEEIFAFGTSAIRDAENQQQFLQEVKLKTGISVEVITGKREAELIYKGVNWSYQFNEPAMIMDIGGGSTEFILADKTGIIELASLNIGVSRIFHEVPLFDPLRKEDVQAIETWIESNSKGFFENKNQAILIGSSGSFETFYELIHNQEFPKGIQAKEIPLELLFEKLNWLIYSSQEERDAHPFILPIRRKLAPIAAAKTRWVLQKLNVKKVFVSPCSLKEGVFQVF